MLVRDGSRIGIVVGRDGSRDLVLDGAGHEPVRVTLDEDEADAVAALLGTPKLLERLSGLMRDADALLVEHAGIATGSPFVGRTIGDTRLRGRTGVSVVAVLRPDLSQPSPNPDFVFRAGDLLVMVGTREGLETAGRILDGTG